MSAKKVSGIVRQSLSYLSTVLPANHCWLKGTLPYTAYVFRASEVCVSWHPHSRALYALPRVSSPFYFPSPLNVCHAHARRLERTKHWIRYQLNLPGVQGDVFRNQDNNEWYKAGVKLVQDNVKLKANTNTAKSAILFLGDGMGITTITATRFLDGQQKGNTGEENILSWEVFPWSALAKTYTVDQQGTDSASSATAFLTGIKTDNGKSKP